jgi:hypothetical protein
VGAHFSEFGLGDEVVEAALELGHSCTAPTIH